MKHDDGFPDTQFDTALAPVAALSAGFTLEDVASMPLQRPPAPGPQGASDAARQGFFIGDLSLMIRFEDGSELIELPVLHSLPNVPSWFLGMANLHGALTPVFDLAAYCGLAPSGHARRMLLVLMHGEDAAGIVIDGLPRRLKLPAGAGAPTDTAPAGLAPHLRGAALVDGTLWFELDCQALLDSVERSLAPH